ncbi:MAG: hypothetical protein JWQ57_681 [Mucilaginibacter sp.]|nr:hypothetical protein [Mucilaginibacter sp.]
MWVNTEGWRQWLPGHLSRAGKILIAFTKKLFKIDCDYF